MQLQLSAYKWTLLLGIMNVLTGMKHTDHRVSSGQEKDCSSVTRDHLKEGLNSCDVQILSNVGHC